MRDSQSQVLTKINFQKVDGWLAAAERQRVMLNVVFRDVLRESSSRVLLNVEEANKIVPNNLLFKCRCSTRRAVVTGRPLLPGPFGRNVGDFGRGDDGRRGEGKY